MLLLHESPPFKQPASPGKLLAIPDDAVLDTDDNADDDGKDGAADGPWLRLVDTDGSTISSMALQVMQHPQMSSGIHIRIARRAISYLYQGTFASKSHYLHLMEVMTVCYSALPMDSPTRTVQPTDPGSALLIPSARRSEGLMEMMRVHHLVGQTVSMTEMARRWESSTGSSIPSARHSEGSMEMMRVHRSDQTTVPMIEMARRWEASTGSMTPSAHHLEDPMEMMRVHRSEQTTVPMTEMARRWEGSTGLC